MIVNSYLRFAHNLILISRKLKELQGLLTELKTISKKLDLTVKLSKTKMMTFDEVLIYMGEKIEEKRIWATTGQLSETLKGNGKISQHLHPPGANFWDAKNALND